MGKNGDLLRKKKAENVTYTFTRAQLEAHDELIRKTRYEAIELQKEEIRKKLYEEMNQQFKDKQKELDDIVTREWNDRAKEFYTDDATENMYNLLSYLCCLSSRVLIEKFHWKPVPKDGNYDRRNRTVRFADYLIDEINKIAADDLQDIRKYNEQTFELYGVKYTREKEETS